MAENGKFLLPITFHPITDKIVEQLKVLNGAIFPIKYQVIRYAIRPTHVG